MFELHWLSFGLGMLFGMMCLSSLIVVLIIIFSIKFAMEVKEEEVVQEGK